MSAAIALKRSLWPDTRASFSTAYYLDIASLSAGPDKMLADAFGGIVIRTMNTSQPSSVATRPLADVGMARATTIAAVGITLAFGALVVPPILIDAQTHSSLACDMLEAHLPQINFFVEHPWNFVDYPGYSVSLPGHHMLLAWGARALGYATIDSTTVPIRLLHAMFGLVFSLILFLFLYQLRRDDSHQSRRSRFGFRSSHPSTLFNHQFISAPTCLQRRYTSSFCT